VHPRVAAQRSADRLTKPCKRGPKEHHSPNQRQITNPAKIPGFTLVPFGYAGIERGCELVRGFPRFVYRTRLRRTPGDLRSDNVKRSI
jgi:hypothetical protein